LGRESSITSSASFREQLLRAEKWRLALMITLFGACIATVVARRLLHDEVERLNSVFIPGIVIFSVAILLLALAFADTVRRQRRGVALPWWRLIAGAAVDLGAPFGVMLDLHLRSPLGQFEALSAPILLVVPIVVMLSVLRLRPWFSLSLGALAALAHAALTTDTLRSPDLPAHVAPLLYTYAVALLFAGLGAAALAWFVRRYIEGAVAEAHEAERTKRALAAVERDMDIARDIQMGLLPTDPPQHPAFELAAMARPADKAGGDYYDWQPLPDGRLVVAIADVTGHGIGPALVMAVCRAYARATAPSASAPHAFLARMNDLIVPDVKGQRFITMAVAVLSPNGSIELVSAGHGPTFLYRHAPRTLEWFGGDGPPLGIAPELVFGPTQRFAMEPGDVLVMLTDGFLERMNASQDQFGMERLMRTITDNAARPPKELISAIDAAVEVFAAGTPQGDDMTAVVVRRR